MRKNTKLILFLLVIVLSFTLITACAKSNESPAVMEDSFDSDAAPENSAILPEGVSRKIIYTVDMDITVDNIKESGDTIEEKVAAFGGWVDKSVERSNTSYSNNYYIIKVPSDKLSELLVEIENMGEVTSKYTESTDITTQYVSATAKKQALESERDALNALVLDDMGEIMERSRRITEINTQLNALQLEINGYNSVVDYSSVNINLYSEDTSNGEVSYGSKISDVFKGSIRSLGLVFIGIVAVFPYLFIIAVIVCAVFGIRFLIKKYVKPKRDNNNKKNNAEKKVDEEKKGE